MRAILPVHSQVRKLEPVRMWMCHHSQARPSSSPELPSASAAPWLLHLRQPVRTLPSPIGHPPAKHHTPSAPLKFTTSTLCQYSATFVTRSQSSAPHPILKNNSV